MNVLWLASWWPNRVEPFSGDFIERHAKSIAPFVQSLQVIVVLKDEKLSYNQTEITVQQQGNITVHIVYYGRSRWGGSIEKMLSVKKYLALQQQVFDDIKNKNGLPDIIHVHVAMKAGLFAKKIKQQYGLPYLLTEHSTLLLPEANPSFDEMSSYYRQLAASVYRQAALVLPVSNLLSDAIKQRFGNIHCRVVPNVVDTTIFYPGNGVQNEQLKLVHVSGMGYQKNLEAIIEALGICKNRGLRFSMQLFGGKPEQLLQLVAEKNLTAEIIFNEEVPQQRIAECLRQSDALILYSRYETFGCVVIEANACGLPVIASDIPVLHEIIQNGLNGVFAEPDNAGALAEVIGHFANSKSAFNKAGIAAGAMQHYSYDVVGSTIKKIYQEITAR